jgi:hypothetical protein
MAVPRSAALGQTHHNFSGCCIVKKHDADSADGTRIKKSKLRGNQKQTS